MDVALVTEPNRSSAQVSHPASLDFVRVGALISGRVRSLLGKMSTARSSVPEKLAAASRPLLSCTERSGSRTTMSWINALALWQEEACKS
jgi:hypothetical protein